VAGDRVRFDRHGRAIRGRSVLEPAAERPACRRLRRFDGDTLRSRRKAVDEVRNVVETSRVTDDDGRFGVREDVLDRRRGELWIDWEPRRTRLVRRDVDDRCLEPVGEYRRHAPFGFESELEQGVSERVRAPIQFAVRERSDFIPQCDPLGTPGRTLR